MQLLNKYFLLILLLFGITSFSFSQKIYNGTYCNIGTCITFKSKNKFEYKIDLCMYHKSGKGKYKINKKNILELCFDTTEFKRRNRVEVVKEFENINKDSIFIKINVFDENINESVPFTAVTIFKKTDVMQENILNKTDNMTNLDGSLLLSIAGINDSIDVNIFTNMQHSSIRLKGNKSYELYSNISTADEDEIFNETKKYNIANTTKKK